MYEYDLQTRKNFRFAWYPNIWDLLAFAVVFLGFYLIGDTLHSMTTTSVDMSVDHIQLDYWSLSRYALHSVVRMFVALAISLLVTFFLGTLAARSAFWERIIIPTVDVLQSAPILGYLTLAASLLMRYFPGQSIGFELVALFTIFTSQVWNMIFSFYQSLRMVPAHMHEASALMQLTKQQKFWRIEVPFAMPDLIMNMMVSLSTSWFYVVESEAILIMHDQRVLLPGIGSYMWVANQQGDSRALIAAVLVMFLVILAYDQLIFRPLTHFIRIYQADDEVPMSRSWFVSMISRTRVFRHMVAYGNTLLSYLMLLMFRYSRSSVSPESSEIGRELGFFQKMFFIVLVMMVFGLVARVDMSLIPFTQISEMIYVGSWTLLRIAVLLVLCVLFWTPIGVWIGFRAQLADRILPVIQFLAAFPPNLLYPLLMEYILRYGLDVDIWCAPLMVLGTQWYIVFNVISAVRSIPKETLYAVRSVRLRGWLLWRRLIIPTIAPHLVTGTMAAAGGAWNAAMVAEVIFWQGNVTKATGLGSYIYTAVANGDVQGHVWAIAVMCAYVVVINRLFWNPLYRYVIKHYANI